VKKAISGFRLLFSSYPIQVGGYKFTTRLKRLRSLLASTHFDLIQIEPWLISYWPLVKKTDAVTVVSFHNIESELMLRQAKIERSLGKHLLKTLGGKRMARIEKSLLYESDLSIVTTEREQRLLKESYPDTTIIVAPNGVDCEAIQLLPPPSDGKRILFVGTLDYAPNIDGVIHFVRNILPILRNRYPSICFQIAGSNPSPRIMALKNEPRVQILGFVPDLAPVYKEASICVAPLRVGGGSRLKILEAMAYGRPIISTRIGCEGLQVQSGKHLLIADEPDEFANAVVRILDDRELGRSLIANARGFVETTHCWKLIVDNVFLNFEGAILSKHNSRAHPVCKSA
jgi:polysaccharide biosynthesis protein PslH